jgi:hypothetical protein
MTVAARESGKRGVSGFRPRRGKQQVLIVTAEVRERLARPQHIDITSLRRVTGRLRGALVGQIACEHLETELLVLQLQSQVRLAEAALQVRSRGRACSEYEVHVTRV